MSAKNAKPSKPAEPQQLAMTEAERQVLIARFSPDGAFIAAGCMDSKIRRWRISDEKPADRKSGDRSLVKFPDLDGHNGWLSEIAFHPSKPFLYSADSWGQLRRTDFTEDDPKTVWTNKQAHDGWIRQLSVSPDGDYIATCGRDQFVRVWAPDGKRKFERKHDEDIFAVNFAPGATRLFFADLKGKVVLLDWSTNKIVREFDATALYKYDRIQDVCGIRILQLLDNNKTLLVAGTKPSRGATVQGKPTLLFFDIESAKVKRTVEFGQDKDCFIEDLVVLADSTVVAVTSGTPGSGLLTLTKPEDEEPSLTFTKISNYHSITQRPGTNQVIVTATNRGSNGNGRRLTKDGEYAGNTSPVYLFELPA